MMILRRSRIGLSIALLIGFSATGQVALNEAPQHDLKYNHSEFRFIESITAHLNAVAASMRDTEGAISLPLPSGLLVDVQLEYAPVMATELAQRYPQIKSFRVHGESVSGRVGITPKGFHGILFTSKGTLYIDPIEGATDLYQSYYSTDYKRAKGNEKSVFCGLTGSEIQEETNQHNAGRGGNRSGEQLRTYDLALACTGEYAQYHGGTTLGALAAMVVTMNRVNGVYERDLAITMQLIGNNDDVIYLNANTDPYSNGNESGMLDENHNNLASVIGTANYDIGHVFGTGGGGIASLGSVCNSNRKGKGVTSSDAPTGDAFDIDYVCHEMGHQFGANHTQNFCSNRVGSAAYEPASASTIMGYAGICNVNLQNNSDDYFHTHSLDEIFDFAYTGSGNGCATTSNTGNSAPEVTAPQGGFTIPIETPFRLDGSATDADNDDLTYCWEQMDLGPSSHPDSPIGNAPLFRSWDPREENYRVFPQMVNIIIGNTVLGETYPDYDRSLNFRLTVRDNNSAGGGTDYDEVSFDVSEDAGPFLVNTPEQGEEVEASSGYEVTWDVANTDEAPVNCETVTIELCQYISGTQKLEVLELLAENTPNDGSETVVISTAQLGGGRYIRVKAADNIFFNINEGSFTVVGPQPLPGAVITLNLTPNFSPESCDLSWNDPFTNEAQWYVERSEGGNQNFVLLDSLPANTTVYNDSNVDVNNGHYVYRVYAGNSVSSSVYSNEEELNLMSVYSLSQSAFSMFPNPAQSSIRITSADIMDVIRISSINGTLMKEAAVQGTETDLNIQRLSAGMYLVEVETNAGRYVSRLEVIR